MSPVRERLRNPLSLVTLGKLQRATDKVIAELEELGFYDAHLDPVASDSVIIDKLSSCSYLKTSGLNSNNLNFVFNNSFSRQKTCDQLFQILF